MKTKFRPNISKSRGSKGSSVSGGRSAEGQAAAGSGKEKEATGGSHSEQGNIPSEGQGSLASHYPVLVAWPQALLLFVLCCEGPGM